VGAVAVGLVFGVLALAQEGGFGFLSLENHGRETLVLLMASIAKGLALGIAAGAPGVGFSGFQLDLGGVFGGDIRFGHKDSPQIVFDQPNSPFMLGSLTGNYNLPALNGVTKG
jgi:hypothetical protein